MPSPALIVVGRVARPHGVRGELRVVPDTDFPERLPALREVVLMKDQESVTARVRAVRPHGAAVLMALEGIDSADAAARWRGAMVAVPRDQAATLPPGRHYVADVIGLRVETEAGEVVGTVTEVIRTGSNDVYVVAGPDGEVLVPAISSVVAQVDVAAGRLIIRPMEGMGRPR